MRDEEVFFAIAIPAAAFAVGLAIRWGNRRFELRKKRLEVLQEALRHPAMDAGVRDEVLRVLADEQAQASRSLLERLGPWLRFGHVLWIAAGWLFLAGGIATWGYSAMHDFPWYSTRPSVIAAIAGFVMLTLPAAVREGLGIGRGRRASFAGR